MADAVDIAAEAVIVGFPASLAVGESELQRVAISEPPNPNQIFHCINPTTKMKTTDEYKAAVTNAVAFKHEHPDEKATTAARIHHVNTATVQSSVWRAKVHDKEVKHGG
jgi:hypothetical protein